MRRLSVLLTLAAVVLCYVSPAAAAPTTNSAAHPSSAPAPKKVTKPAPKKVAKPAPKPRHAAQPAKYKPAAKKPASKHGTTARVRPAAKK